MSWVYHGGKQQRKHYCKIRNFFIPLESKLSFDNVEKCNAKSNIFLALFWHNVVARKLLGVLSSANVLKLGIISFSMKRRHITITFIITTTEKIHVFSMKRRHITITIIITTTVKICTCVFNEKTTCYHHLYYHHDRENTCVLFQPVRIVAPFVNKGLKT